MSGCALWKPAGAPPLAPGAQLRAVEVVLEPGDPAGRFVADLQVEQLAPGGVPGRVRVGCAWRGLPSAAADTLQAWIVRGRRRRDLIALSFD